MLISKLDLYKSGWLELVFDNRNKAYGAYYLRQHYAGNMVKAMGITFFGVFLFLGGFIIFQSKPDAIKIVQVINDPNIHVVLPIEPPKTVKPPSSLRSLKAELPAKPAATQKYVEMKPVPDQIATTNPVLNKELTGAIGTETTPGVKNAGNEMPVAKGTGTQPTDESIHSLNGVDVMPEPVGGEGAWARFLNKNLRFPAAAQDEGVSGKVFLSFIIEKDGSLSNIVVEHGAGHGFDEEALRVLKLAKSWKPGMQNGQPVRVKYTIPINFQLAE